MFDRLLDDIRHGARILTKAPGLSATAALLIALVVGGNVTVYSTVNGFIRRPAPGVTATGIISFGLVGRPGAPFFRFGDYTEYAQAKSLRSLAAWGFSRAGVTTRNGTHLLQVTPVTRNYFDTIGVVPATGRAFTVDDDRPGAPLVAVISDAIWNVHFERAADIVGRNIEIGGRPATIVGVTPALFAGPSSGEWSDVWVPIRAYATIDDGWGVAMIGRLAPGSTVDRVRAEISAIQGRLPALPGEERAPVLVTEYAASAGGVIPAFERQILAIFSIITLLTLVVVGANVANLMLARAVARQRETAVRLSLGASRVRLVRLVAVEGLSISAVACVLALVLSYWVAWYLPAFLPRNRGTIPVDFTPDWHVAAYAGIITLLGTVISSVVPGLRAWKTDPLPSLKDGGHTSAPARSRLSSGLVVVQLAFSVLLLTTGVITYRSWTLMSSSAVGFDTSRLLLVTVGTNGAAASPQERIALLDRIRRRFGAIPTVSSVSYTRERSRGEVVRSLSVREPIRSTVTTVGVDYLQTLGVAPAIGRDVSATDQLRTGGTAVINRSLGAALFPGTDPIGQTLLVGDDRRAVDVVGLVPDLYFLGFDSERPDMRPNYVFLSDQPTSRRADENTNWVPSTFYVRYTGALEAMSAAVPSALADVDPRLALAGRETFDNQLEQQGLTARIISMLLTIFAGMSLLIAAIGQYAAVAFDMRRRTRDVGVRMALGASARQIIGSVLRGGAALTLGGLAGGFVLSLGVATALRGFLFGVTPTDPPTYLVVFVLLACVSLFACYLPARRASRIDPVQALRQE